MDDCTYQDDAWMHPLDGTLVNAGGLVGIRIIPGTGDEGLAEPRRLIRHTLRRSDGARAKDLSPAPRPLQSKSRMKRRERGQA
jgi:hypothetical protein